MEIQEFAEIVVRYGIGGYGLGVFAIRELLDVMSDRNVVVDLDFEQERVSARVSTRKLARRSSGTKNK